MATIQAAFSEIFASVSLGKAPAELKNLCLELHNWYLGKRVAAISEELFPGIEGHHATPSEVSLSYYAFPQHTKSVDFCNPQVAPSGTFTYAFDFKNKFPDGRIGSDPSQASVETGQRLCEASTTDVIERLQSLGFL